MTSQCGCGVCCFPTCPPSNHAKPMMPYDEISHEVDNNFISFKLPKNVRQAENVSKEYPRASSGDKPENETGQEFTVGCKKLNVIPNKSPPPKKPDEEMFILSTSKRLINKIRARFVRHAENVSKDYPRASSGDKPENETGQEFTVGCKKLNVIPNKSPPPKKPDEEMFILSTSKRLINVDELKNSLEIEIRTPRNYIPLPEPGPPPPIIQIIPKTPEKRKGKKKKK
ncbi:uncharacterized protein LOC105702508 [Orussus abietinus]|uniref:uncharacterized protein LOC105702508 n=1 Tax=Orussus abietinus TaxID=222816 RepID=UPI000C715DEE|nr:uncharacterized protein LOC105702508 [Orussus abietinus]